MQVFGSMISPFVRKVCVVIEEKGLPYEVIAMRPHADDPAFRAASPLGKIPAMIDGDCSLADSSAIVAYIDAKHPHPPMMPQAPEARGQTVWYDEFADTVVAPPCIQVLFNRFLAPKVRQQAGDEAKAAQNAAELPRALDYLEGVAPESGWLVKADFTVADIAVASVLRSLDYVGFGPDASVRPRTAAWYARVAERPAWQRVAEAEDALYAQFR